VLAGNFVDVEVVAAAVEVVVVCFGTVVLLRVVDAVDVVGDVVVDLLLSCVVVVTLCFVVVGDFVVALVVCVVDGIVFVSVKTCVVLFKTLDSFLVCAVVANGCFDVDFAVVTLFLKAEVKL